MLSRPPLPALRPFVRLVWADVAEPAMRQQPWREHVLPTGCMHLALRWGGPPLRLFGDAADATGTTLGHAVVGGARNTFYVKEAGVAGWSVGAQLEPGAASALFRDSAEALAGRHTPLADLCGRDADILLERMQAQPDPASCLELLETWLLARLPRVRGIHPGVAASLAVLHQGARVEEAVRASGLSHRHLVAKFREATGLAPKQHARILRLQAALARLGAPGAPAAEVALDAGYADQAHFSRDFRAFVGMTPTDWLRAAPAQPNHVRVRFVQDAVVDRP
ncbi:helix-turn-helix transcriptional regulator [Caenimonas sedimenti]|uniref:Helix-turn-helix transcriptional regulator n=2 Tax=Caenimonas sedimenti TaxID=2596921 RepID=A0A562ZGX9_9BURK|nr:helix-turn-helix transcriptional regulator [Caenimonas sedimenti]